MSGASRLDWVDVDLRSKGKSRPSTMLLRSVVTRLFSFPVRLSVLLRDFGSLLLLPSNSFPPAPEVDGLLDFPLLAELFMLELPLTRVSEAASFVLAPASLVDAVLGWSSPDMMEAVSGVVAPDVGVEVDELWGTCAFMRIRNACSNTNSVIIPSALTRVPVCDYSQQMSENLSVTRTVKKMYHCIATEPMMGPKNNHEIHTQGRIVAPSPSVSR